MSSQQQQKIKIKIKMNIMWANFINGNMLRDQFGTYVRPFLR
jgi:hypothetical protein